MPYDEQVMAVLEGRGLQAGVAEAGPSKLKLFLIPATALRSPM